MLYPIKLADIELSRPINDFEGLDGYIALKALVRLHGTPLGYVQAALTTGRCTAHTLSKLILEQYHWHIITNLLRNGLAAGVNPEGLRLEDLFDLSPEQETAPLPVVTVAVCTRDRTPDLALCLESLCQLDYPKLDILVVDNAPTSDATKLFVNTKYPQVRYALEPRPGLDWARNRAIIEAKGEIIAYTDDDVIVDPGWITAIAKEFAEHPEVMAVTGLVVPYELETESQVLFEMYGGFGKGFDRKQYSHDPNNSKPAAAIYGFSAQCGTGANMAYRRSLFDLIGVFDPALDVGTVTNGGGDIEMFFRVIKEGYTLVYQPKAMVRHRHRRDLEKLRSQIANNGIGLYAYFVRSAIAYPDERLAFIKLGIWWLFWWLIRRLFDSYFHPARFPRDLILVELLGCFPGLTRYQKARQIAAEIEKTFGPTSEIPTNQQPIQNQHPPKRKTGQAVRSIELTEPLGAIADIAEYSSVRVFVKWHNWPIGSIDIANPHQFISKTRLIDEIVNYFGLVLIELNHPITKDARWNQAINALKSHYIPPEAEKAIIEPLPAHIPVSVVIATLDRPDDLRNCLRCLFAQESPRQVEIVVIDNNPASGLTPPVIAEFPGIVLANEPRKGLSYARNKGFTTSTGDICIATDDDVTMPPDWLEKLVAPFARPDIMVVTANVLPVELEAESQQRFESYGGLGRGFENFKVAGEWFESFPRKAVPTWTLGATANAAFRSTIFSHPEIGLMDEALGPGMPSGVGEDTYVFYKVLKAGYTIMYQADAYVWHKHRNNMAALNRQIYAYSKGGPSYHITTWLQDGDWRGVWRVLIEIPDILIWRIKARLRRWNDYPFSLIWLEFLGYLAGPWSLWQSRQRLQREGKSDPYIPVSKRYTNNS